MAAKGRSIFGKMYTEVYGVGVTFLLSSLNNKLQEKIEKEVKQVWQLLTVLEQAADK